MPSKRSLVDQKNFPFYVIEGIDGSGKSSIGPQVAEAIEGAFYEYPNAFKPAIKFIDSKASPEARFLFYMGYNLQTSHDVLEILNEQPVICVRYIYSTIVYHIVKGVDIKSVFNISRQVSLLRPKQVFFLDVSNKDVQMRRLEKRGLQPEDSRILEKMDLIRNTYLQLSSIMPNFTYIDTSSLTKAQVISAVIKNIV